jgi:hypothetical protein
VSDLLAVNGCVLADTSATPGAPAITITSLPSLKVKVGGAGAFSGGIAISVSGTDGAGCTLNSPVTAVIPPGATKARVDGALANIVGDKIAVSGPGTSGDDSCTAAFIIEIVGAGQTKTQVV